MGSYSRVCVEESDVHHLTLKIRAAWNISWTRYCEEEEGSAVFQNCTDTVRMYFTVREVFFTLYRPPYPPVAQLRGRRPLGPTRQPHFTHRVQLVSVAADGWTLYSTYHSI